MTYRASNRIDIIEVLKRIGPAQETHTFRFFGDLHHCLYGTHRVRTRGGFAREHNGVAAVKDGVGDIAGLGAGGPWIADHRIEHLRCRDHRFVGLCTAANDHLLDHWHRFGAGLDA